MNRTVLCCATVLICICSFVQAQNPQSNASAIGIPLGRVERADASYAKLANLQCATVPNESQATSTILSYYVLDTDFAAKVGIQFVGTATGTAELRDVVLVRERRKYASCETTDGSGTLQYGHALRATVLVTARDLSVDVNFAIVAASATLKNRSAQVLIQNTGFADPAVDRLSQEAMSTVAATGLNVVTFSKFSEKLEAAYSAAVGSVLSAPLEKLAFVPKTDSATTSRSLATAFGLQCLSEGRTCAEAMAQFPARGQDSDNAIRDIYGLVTNSCGTVNPIQRLQAQTILGSIRVQPRCHRED
jgi:hypothetical protein